MEHPQRDPQRLSALYQYHNAPEVAPAHGLEYDDTIHSASSDKYPVVHDRHYDPPHHSKMYNNDRPPRIIFGMEVRTFLLVALVMVLLVVSAAVGGAVGGKNMRENHVQQDAWPASTEEAGSSSSSTSPPSSVATSISATTYSAAVPTYTPLNPCPDANNTRYTSTQPNDNTSNVSGSAGLNFTRYCNVDSPFESSSASATKKISEAFVYSLDDCIELCASSNFWTETDNCTVAVYDVKGRRPGNCWIGSASEVETRGSEEKEGVAVAMLSI